MIRTGVFSTKLSFQNVLSLLLFRSDSSQLWECTPALKKLMEEDCCEFKASLGDTASCLTNKTKQSKAKPNLKSC